MKVGEGEGRFGPTDQHQPTVYKFQLYLVVVGETIGSKVDSAKTGVGGDPDLSTEARLYKIDPSW